MTIKINGTPSVIDTAKRIQEEARQRAIARARDNVAHARENAHDAEARANIKYFFNTLKGPGVFK